MKFTSSEKQLIKNAIILRKQNGKMVKPHLLAFVENDAAFIEAFNKKASIYNDRAKSEGWSLTVTFNEQIQWDIDAFREIKEIRELQA